MSKSKSVENTVLSVQTGIATPKGYVFLFGPWSGSVKDDKSNEALATILERLRGHVTTTLDEAYASHTLEPTSRTTILDTTRPLEFQLRTLASQLLNVERLASVGISPTAVVGYCFGEFAAAITSGNLSEKGAIDIITKRALLVEDSRLEAGAMLNAFAPIKKVRATLALLPSPVAEIAIYAGPSHTVLSGSIASITEAQQAFQAAGIKAIKVDTTMPFHSRIMDKPIRRLKEFLSEDVYPARIGSSSLDRVSPSYVSGLTGRILPGHRIGSTYWLRHMREPVRFLESMETIRQTYCGEPGDYAVIDVGPGTMLKGIVGRYGWDDLKVVAVEDRGFWAEIHPTTEQIPSLLPHVPIETIVVPNDAHISSGPTSSNVAVPTPSTIASSSTEERRAACLHILTEMFGYDSDPEILNETIQDLGLNSMDFIRLSGELQKQLGVAFSPDAYMSNETIGNLLIGLQVPPEGMIIQVSASPIAEVSETILTAPTISQSVTDASTVHAAATVTSITVSNATSNVVLTPSLIPLDSPKAQATPLVLPSDQEVDAICIDLMATLFGYDPDPEFLQETFQDLGLNSMDFIQLSGELRKRLGFGFSTDAYASNEAIVVLLRNLEEQGSDSDMA